MQEILAIPGAQVVLWAAVLCMLTAGGWYIVSRVRGQARGGGKLGDSLLFDFRELHLKGELSDEEYRTIKSKLAASMHRQSQDAADKA